MDFTRKVCLLAIVRAASAQMIMKGIRCGQLTCQPEEYCNLDTNRCSPCNVVCNGTNHNHDFGLCAKECVAYLLNLTYVQNSDRSRSSLDFTSVAQQAQAALIMSSVAMAVLVIILIVTCRGSLVFWRIIKQRFQPAKNRVKSFQSEIHHNLHAEMSKPKYELKLEIPDPDAPRSCSQPLNVRALDTRNLQTEKSAGETAPKTISTALSNRHPAEDTTLDFSYDNMGMNLTPPEQPAATHNF